MSGMGLSLSDLCCLLCCPPSPARIAAKLAFMPPEPTYSIEEEKEEPGKEEGDGDGDGDRDREGRDGRSIERRIECPAQWLFNK